MNKCEVLVNNIKSIEFYENGTIKKIEFYEPPNDRLTVTMPNLPDTRQVPQWPQNDTHWWNSPYKITMGSATAGPYHPFMVFNEPVAREWFTPEEDEAWKGL